MSTNMASRRRFTAVVRHYVGSEPADGAALLCDGSSSHNYLMMIYVVSPKTIRPSQRTGQQ
jgi:hypothetical protein